ncbi:L1 [Macaca mulatta papillomavirus 4]|uniref:Major capsid protein L1 n=1 Tax=Macaca mulatta papillomavirus 4 TaxID=2294152 RepID=A0A385AHS0_9PAPI|nr:L1 [Macaca mulatta papillomavirus 4]AXN57300.1 L1 [Macaca mulatta papillomavirus 4]
MAVWLPSAGKLYLPPSKPVPRVLSTDEYVKHTSIFFQASSDRLLTVGHPFFNIYNQEKTKVLVPKVSGSQYRVFRFQLPDPNQFALIDKSVYDPEKERLVWKLRGMEISRGGPLGVGTTGHPFFNKLADTENPNKYPSQSTDDRQNVSMDPKQTQLFIVGCTPCTGQHWDVAPPCADQDPQPKKGDCPAIQLVTSVIQDGDMCDIGFGHANFKSFQENHSDVPLDIVASTCKWPDFGKMSKDVYGNQMFFFGKREQMYARHYFARAGTVGDAIPDPFERFSDFFVQPANNQAQRSIASHIYYATPSGSLVSSEATLFNRAYWLNRAQGTNNGILWGNNIFLTLVDNTHSTNFTLNVYSETEPKPETYKASNYKQYLRHVEEFEVEFILQLCSVPLEADILAHLNVMDPRILEDWNLAFVPPPPTGIEDTYRYIHSLATRCPSDNPPAEKEDPYKNYSFWTVDLSDKLTTELGQTSLGRRFVYQTNVAPAGSKRVRPSSSVPKRAAKKRKVK